MTKKSKFYITTTLPYVNAKPHMGHALEFIRADILARHKRKLLGKENVFFNTGTDEHGQKLYSKALEENLSPQEYVDKMAVNFKELLSILNIEPDNFIRTTDESHKKSAQKLWEICDKAGYIYKKNYQGKYCVGCELEKKDSDLVNGCCPEHPNTELEIRDEENYFFAWSKFEKKLIEYFNREDKPIKPDFRKNEIENFVKGGLQDFSVSRLKEKMSWGIPVPNDDDHVMYVWFDALTNYISTLGWGSDDESLFEKFWADEDSTIFQICGKDNLRQQSAMWQGMLMAGMGEDKRLRTSDVIFVEGFIITDGQKMSKSLGNVVDPLAIIEKYGVDLLRYYMARHINHFEDSNFTLERLHEDYTANLVNGIGNLTNRILAMSESLDLKIENKRAFDPKNSLLENYDFNEELNIIWKKISEMDSIIAEKKPFSLIKESPKEAREIILPLMEDLYEIADRLEVVIPESAQKIKNAIEEGKKPENPIFPRIDFY